MGTQFKGPFSGFSGKTGGLVGRYVKGQFVITSRPIPSKKPPTQKQLDQRSKFALIVNFCSYIGDLLDIGFAAHTMKLSAMNAAIAYNLDHAITGVSPLFSIDYPHFSYSRGKLYGVSDVEVEALAGAKLKFTWTVSQNTTKLNKPTDQLSILVYNPTKQQYVVLTQAALRSTLTFTLQLPANFAPDDVYCFLALASVTGVVSNSQYAGSVAVI
ncbi:hypothetical protein GO495_06675 [Chitinophaga oryziterrae]|uniref:Uncharacterized protein n=1 Tax=Chitinophaga oryziterrae TaxID=1031224 RepID=A0A6N8J7R6_9BACT|nr:DUF6266 family protein [Chitinophaga oryziterrae]MVT40259.1 hypothetical protein [Chitinophaga oryziterrae]